MDFSTLTALSAGFSGAEITAVCTEAAMLAIEKDIDGSDRRSGSSNSCSGGSSGGDDSNSKTCELCVGMQELREAIAATKPQITNDMLAFYADLVKRM